jgi:hypothetical protein
MTFAEWSLNQWKGGTVEVLGKIRAAVSRSTDIRLIASSPGL